MTAAAPNPAPKLVFTVAITGHQDILPDREPALQAQVRAILRDAARALGKRQRESALDAPRPRDLRFVSALAPGADQIGAEAALDPKSKAEGWRLKAILPFDRETFARLARATLEKRDAAKPRGSPLRLGKAAITRAVNRIASLAGEADRVLELSDWQPSGAAPEAEEDWQSRRYATIGQMLVRRADLLIALWDGSPPRGRGGTADVVTEARRSGVPVVWINPHDPDPKPRSLTPDPGAVALSASDFVKSGPAARTGAGGKGSAKAAIARAIDQVLLGHAPDRATCIANFLQEQPTRTWVVSPAPGETGEGLAPGDSFLSYARMLYLFLRFPTPVMRKQTKAQIARGEPPVPLRSYPFRWARLGEARVFRRCLTYPFGFGVDDNQPGTANAAPVLEHARRADALANRLSNQYRSAYVWIFMLAPFAVTWAVLSVLVPSAWKPLFVVLELATVTRAAVIYWRTSALDPVAEPRKPPSWWRRLLPRPQDTHQRWLDARLIAESQRSGQLLAWVGFSGRRPIEEPRKASAEPAQGKDAGHDGHDDGRGHGHGHDEGHAHAPPRTVWAPHYANAVAALPELPHDAGAGDRTTCMTATRVAEVAKAAARVIADQRGYHDLNHQRLEALNHRLDTFSLRAIGLAFIVSAAYLALWALGQLEPAAWLPALAAQGLYALYKGSSTIAAFFGAVLPAVAAAAAGIRFQGDFERFAMRSKTTAEALERLAERAEEIAQRAEACGDTACTGQPPLFEPLLELLLDTQSALDEDLADWRFAYAARPLTLG